MSTYELVDDGAAIKCLICNRTSWNSDDVRHRFCVGCDIFHEDMRPCRFCGCPVPDPCTHVPPDICPTAQAALARPTKQ